MVFFIFDPLPENVFMSLLKSEFILFYFFLFVKRLFTSALLKGCRDELMPYLEWVNPYAFLDFFFQFFYDKH